MTITWAATVTPHVISVNDMDDMYTYASHVLNENEIMGVDTL